MSQQYSSLSELTALAGRASAARDRLTYLFDEGNFTELDAYAANGPELSGVITAFGYADRHQGEVFLLIIIERWAAPMALRMGWFLLHRENQAVIIDLDYAALMEAVFVGLIIAHDAGRIFFLSVRQEALQAEG